MRRPFWLLPCLAAVAACRPDTVVSSVDPQVVVANPELWTFEPLRLVSSSFRAGVVVEVSVDGAVALDTVLAGPGSDTLAVQGYWSVGGHSVAVRVGDRRVPATPLEVHGFTGAYGFVRVLTGRPLALGQGSSKFWVGTSQGLAILDALAPATPPQLVDASVDASCLWALTPERGGGVVTADRGCGTLRSRRYAATVVEVDSGPSASGWNYAVNGRPGVWLLVNADSVAVAIRQGDGSWQWTVHRWSEHALGPWGTSTDHPPVVSPDGRVAAVGRGRTDGAADLLVFDLDGGTLLFRQDSAPGPAVAFSLSGDTLVGLQSTVDSSGGQQHTDVVLLDGHTGRRLEAFPILVGSWPPFAYDVVDFGPLAWDPLRPWLYARLPNGCPGFLAIDRRTWHVAGRMYGYSSDVPECDAEFAVSGFTSVGWALWLDFVGGSYGGLSTFTIPDP